MVQSPYLFCKDTKGGIRYWAYEVDGGKWRTISGINGSAGTPIITAWTTVKPKNVGRKNATTVEQQAALEAEAAFAKKLDRKYRRTEAELESVAARPMLAQDYTKQKSIPFPAFSQPKLDGIRSLTGTVGAFSRQFQQHLNVGHILEALVPVFEKHAHITLDGELYNHDLRDDFNSISSVVRTQKITPEDSARARALIQYHVYDVFGDGTGDIPFHQRRHFLADVLARCNLTDPDCPIRLVPTTVVKDVAAVDVEYETLLAAGYEGQIVRLDGPYQNGARSKLLLKRKEWITAEFKLIAIEEGTGNWAQHAKRIVFRQEDGSEPGAGLVGTKAFAKKLLAERDKYLGPRGMVTIKYFTPTPDNIPRFARAIDFHPEGRKD